MAWVTPRTWTINEIVTAAELNEQVRDNLNFLKTATGAHGGRWNKSGTAPTYADSTDNILTWNNEITDTDGYWTSGTQITIPAGLGGLYCVSGVVGWAGSGVGMRQVSVLKNGTTMAFCQTNANPAGNSHNFSFDNLIASATDYFEIGVKQTSGGDLALATSTSYFTWVAVRWNGAP